MGIIVAILLVCGVVIALLMMQYKRPRRGVEVIHSTLDTFKVEYLLERSPVLVVDPLIDIQSVVRAWFSWNVVGGTTRPYEEKRVNSAKFLVVHGGSVKAPVVVTNPAHSELGVRILVPPHAVLIVPHRWYVEFPGSADMSITEVDDLVTIVSKIVGV